MTEKMFIPKEKKLLNPKIDSTFKTIFTRDGESSQVALRSLVGAIIGHEPEEVTVIGNELPEEVIYAKNIRLDLRCRMPDGSHIALEMQTCPRCTRSCSPTFPSLGKTATSSRHSP